MNTSIKALLATAGLLLLATNSQAADVELRIGYLRGPSDLSLVQDSGELDRTLAKLGVKVHWLGPFPAAAPAYEALNGGSLDMTSGTTTAFVTSIASGVPMAMFGYQAMPANGEGIVVKQGSAIHSVADLKGKHIAVNRGGTGEYLLSRALQTAGVDEASVHKEYLTPADSGSAFSSGHIDGWATWDPYLAIARNNYDGRVLVNGQQLGSENAAGYFIRNDFLAAHPAVVKAILDTLLRTNTWARQHPLEAGRVWARQMGNQNDDVARQLGETNVSPLQAVGPEQAEHIRHIAQWYLDQHIIRSAPDVSQFVTDLSR
ncbi:aliphatic sulfonate ABC transporter substrate-binding protein [Pseudomonas putida]